MAVRPTMQRPISVLRRLGSCATNDIFNSVTYWTDEQLQDILDANLLPSQPVPLRENVRFVAGERDWGAQTIMLRPYMILEEDATVIDGFGQTVNAAFYTVNYVQKLVLFDTAAAPYRDRFFIQGKVYHLYNAAADVWQEKANQRSNYARWKAGNYSVDAEAEYEHCLQRAMYYRGLVLKRHKK